jgi:hypothetical protein
MKGVKLTERIRYMHCEGDQGAHGILILLGISHLPTKAVEIESQADFRKFYAKFVSTEKIQNELLNPHLVPA